MGMTIKSKKTKRIGSTKNFAEEPDRCKDCRTSSEFRNYISYMGLACQNSRPIRSKGQREVSGLLL